MAVITDIRKSFTDATPVLAVVGATDLAVERVRKAAANATKTQEKAQEELQAYVAKAFDPKTLQANAQQVPALAVSRALEFAGRVEGVYEDLAARGKQLVDRVESQRATQELLSQGRSTIGRGKAAVTTARRAVDETATAARGVVTVGRRGAGEIVSEVEGAFSDTERTAGTAAKRTRTAAKRTTTTARKRAVSTRSATKGVATSARKTAAKAVIATEDAAKKVGD